MLDEGNMPYSTCVRCSTCDGFPCLAHAKSDAEVLGVRPALEHPNVTLLTGALVTALTTNPAGTVVAEVTVERDGERETYTADIVVVSCGAANTAKLLLGSANDRHPNGLANGSDQVGRSYMFHNSQAVLAISKEPNPTTFQKRLSTEDLRRAENRVTVDRDGKLTLHYRSSNDTARDRLFEQLRSLLGHLGMHEHHLIPRWAYLENKIPVAGVAHQAGTCRFGSDPNSSVLNTDCRAHELDNLYVVDTSFFPSISAVNPALTPRSRRTCVNNSASGSYALTVMSIVTVIFLPVVLLYQGWSFHVFRARVKAPPEQAPGPEPAAPRAG
jgi:choline dehydrogenase-like flavoprotein